MRKMFILLLLSAAIAQGAPGPATKEEGRVIPVTGKKFEFVPARIVVEKGETVTLNFTSADTKHGFKCEPLGLAEVEFKKGKPARVTFKAEKAGTYEFKCSHFCGRGHKKMRGEIVVVEPE